MSTAQVPAIDMNKLNAFIGQFVTDLGAAVHTGMVVIGERLGLYKTLAADPLTSSQLAARTKTDERYVREWLSSQAAGGYVTYDPKTDKFSLSEEQAFTLANEDSPAYLPGAFELALGSLQAVPRIAESFRTGHGMGWNEHSDAVFHGCEKFFRPGYAANLESFDKQLATLLPQLRSDDLLVITADHGNDPSTPSTDHSREYVPLLLTGSRVRKGKDLGTRETFADLGQTLADLFRIPPLANGVSFLSEILEGS